MDTYKQEIEKLHRVIFDPANIVDIKDYTYPTIINLAMQVDYYKTRLAETTQKIIDIYKAEFE
jgi:hypothetical protein